MYSAPIYSDLCVDPELRPIVAEFVNELPNRVDAMLACFQQGQLDQLETLAHQVKGAAGSYGFAPVTPVASELEVAARDRATEAEIHAALRNLQEIVGRLTADAPA